MRKYIFYTLEKNKYIFWSLPSIAIYFQIPWLFHVFSKFPWPSKKIPDFSLTWNFFFIFQIFPCLWQPCLCNVFIVCFTEKISPNNHLQNPILFWSSDIQSVFNISNYHLYQIWFLYQRIWFRFTFQLFLSQTNNISKKIFCDKKIYFEISVVWDTLWLWDI